MLSALLIKLQLSSLALWVRVSMSACACGMKMGGGGGGGGGCCLAIEVEQISQYFSSVDLVAVLQHVQYVRDSGFEGRGARDGREYID